MTPEEEAEAQQRLQEIIDTTAPKGLGQGLKSGVSNIVGGAIGGAGVAVLAPTLGLAAGLSAGGLVGGIVGLTGGALLGALGAAGLIVAGTLTGVTQIIRGVAAAPEAAMAPRQGKWWNENDGKWVLTNMDEEIKGIASAPEDDGDLLGDIEKELDSGASAGDGGGDVVDMFYYETLEVATNSDEATIRRRYYLLAKKYHPDRNKGDESAAERFKDIAEAYQVLSDPELRKRYNRDGRGGLSADKTSVNDNGVAKIDPAILFAFLFGSDKFNDYVGRLATATSAQIGNSPKISIKDARTLQKRRVVRLASKLIDKIAPWVAAKSSGDGDVTAIEAEWTVEADELATASFGYQLITTIGKLYNLMAIQYQGSINSGQGLPSVSKWAERQKASMDKHSYSNKNKMETLKAGIDMLKLQQEAQVKLQSATTEEEKQRVTRELEEHSVGILLRVLWTTTVVDITSTIFEVTHMVFFDQSVDKDARMARSEAVKRLGEIWMDRPAPEGDNEEEKDAKKLYEEAAFAAMLETVKRKDASNA